jgi:hypothetical protein
MNLDAELAATGAVLVEPRVLRRVIKVHRQIRGIGLQVPHEDSYALPRAELAPIIERDEVKIDLATLPERVVVVSGDRDELAAGAPAAMTKVWSAIFHGHVHLVFDEMAARGELAPRAVRERIHRLGQTEFDEIRSVLRQEDQLLPPGDDRTIYVEFVAVYLELKFFSPAALGRTFPAVFDTARIDAAIALDLDAEAVLAAARPARAPVRPVIAAADVVAEPPRPTVPVARVVPGAKKPAAAARKRGNRSRAAILAALAGDRAQAEADLDELAARVARALGGGDPVGWRRALLPVAELAAAQRTLRFDPRARLLHDLQAACIDAEREERAVDLVGWIVSRGKKKPIRALPATREVRIAKRMTAALAKVPALGLAPEARAALTEALRDMTHRAESNLRSALRPKVAAALAQVGLRPNSPPERIGEKKLIDELLDRAVAVGHLSLPDLRDAISRNDLKMPNLDRAQIRPGDPLLAGDRILATSLDGVYRRGEVYLRFLQRVSSVLFGTPIGRFFTLYLMLPLLGSFAVVEGLHHMVAPVAKLMGKPAPDIATREALWGGAGFLFLLLHVWPFRRGMVLLARGLWRVIRFVLYDLPRAIWRTALVQRLLGSALARWLVKPAIPAAITWPIAWHFLLEPYAIAVTAGVFVLSAIVLNLRFGRLVEEILVDWLVRSARQFTGRIIPASVKYTLAFFAKLVELFDRGVYRIDEWLRFRGRSMFKLVIKAVLGTLWSVVRYVLRLYVNLFVEPTVNPIKHFPVVTVAAKLIIPFIPAILEGVAGPATRVMGPTMGNSFAAFTVLVLPGLAGFLVWELKENWKLYQATRPKTLRTVAVGHHGESMATFLAPGFHSGTVPKLYTRLRRAAWRGDEQGVARQKEGLHHVEEAVARFVDRQLVSMLNDVRAFRASDVAVHDVEIGSNRIGVALACPSLGKDHATIRFEHQSGWLVASLAEPGWAARLDGDQRTILETALAGFYKLSAVDLVREQLEHALAGGATTAPPYDVADHGLVVWSRQGFEIEAIYDLRSTKLAPRGRSGPYEGSLPVLRGKHVILRKEPLYWAVWTSRWRQIERGDSPARIVVGPDLLGGRTSQ